ncbi:sugar ABC transporter permease [Roseomonas sp. E05]|uniref:carbohydrate ABC transporter permease n=1 Tax=Roseomonas sp. E05 TaxID=3046310 RepID=UPI0024BB86A1|nr:sugar ABC transporter permease [Roseomonas sp. E05]MDJ0388855.1 sugar ABC transporter permease [Roseomonas sp. E05]
MQRPAIMLASLARPALAGARPRQPARRRWHGLAGYLFLLPWLIGFFGLTLGPAVASLILSFTHFDLITDPRWAGLANYRRIAFIDTKFWASLHVTFTYVLLSVPLKLAFALGVAMVLNKGMRGLTVYRAIFYLPSLLGGSVAIAVLWREIFSGSGLLNRLLALVGLHGPSWIADPDTAIYTLVVLGVWQFGSPMIIFLAGLRQIPQDLYEAASLDGASRRRQFFRITLPLLTPIIFFNAIVQVIDAFKAFTPAFIISDGGGGPINATLFYTLYLYQEAFGNFRMGYASALAWILVLIIGTFTAISFLSARYWVHYDE